MKGGWAGMENRNVIRIKEKETLVKYKEINIGNINSLMRGNQWLRQVCVSEG